ncbi:MAG: hypothetical protein IPF98_22135 [Gemmatimonadetes bacterium]|nr:hypothetical protein [Gemmatimonadota bacterium]
MFLFKASGDTYGRVVRQEVHAFRHDPAEVFGDEFVLLSKNRDDCAMLEKQVQHVAKLLEVRKATPAELELLFPTVNAGTRWDNVVRLYWRRELSVPFNLSEVSGLNEKFYRTVQGFSRLKDADAICVVQHRQDK